MPLCMVSIQERVMMARVRYIKLKTKTQNNIVIFFEFFVKKFIVILAFFETI